MSGDRWATRTTTPAVTGCTETTVNEATERTHDDFTGTYKCCRECATEHVWQLEKQLDEAREELASRSKAPALVQDVRDWQNAWEQAQRELDEANELGAVALAVALALEEARAKLARVEALHHPDRTEPAFCEACGLGWPCRTQRALDGTE